MNDADRDVVAITQLVNLYGLAVDSHRRQGPGAHPGRLAHRPPGMPDHLVDRQSAGQRNDPRGEVRPGHPGAAGEADAGRVGILAAAAG